MEAAGPCGEGSFQAEGAGCAKALRLVCPRNPMKACLPGVSRGYQAMCLEGSRATSFMAFVLFVANIYSKEDEFG